MAAAEYISTNEFCLWVKLMDTGSDHDLEVASCIQRSFFRMKFIHKSSDHIQMVAKPNQRGFLVAKVHGREGDSPRNMKQAAALM